MTRFAVHAPVKVTMIFVAVALLGLIALRGLPTSLFPDIRAPKVTTTVRTRGLSPLEIERRINEPLERQLYTIRGVKDVRTIARADSSVVVAEFTWDTPLDFAFLDVKKAVGDLQRQAAQDIESASVLRYDPNAAPVMVVGLVADVETESGSLTLEDLRHLADQTLKPRFERLPGIANVVLSGGEEREALVALDEALLLTHDLDVAMVVEALRAENVNATGGYVQDGTRRYLLKAIGEFADLSEVRSVVVKRQADAPILLSDVARVEFTPREPEGIVFVNGVEGVGLSFFREAEANTVAVAEAIRGELDLLQQEEGAGPPMGGPAGGPPGEAGGDAIRGRILPDGLKLVVASDQSQFIQAALDEVWDNALMGGILSALIILVFLRFSLRTTFIICLSIPVSIVATFALMDFQNLTLNLMTLGGLALGVGMVVDNAIVVLENIFRLRSEGVGAEEAAVRGSGEVSAAIIASTLTTVVVFLPVVYVEGVAGLLFREQALTVVYSMLASLFVALLLIPMLASRILRKPPRGVLASMESDNVEGTRGWYASMLRGCLRARWLVLMVAVALLVLSVLLAQRIPQEFLPRTEQRQISLRLVLPNGSPIEATRQVVEYVQGVMEPYRVALESTYARVGEATDAPASSSEDPDGPNTADLYLTLHPWDEPTTPMVAAGLGNFRPSDLISVLKPRLDALPEVKAEFRLQQGSIFDLIGSSTAPLLVEVRGEDIPTLTRLAEEAQRRLAATPGLLNVRTNILAGSPEVLVTLDKTQAARLGLDVQTVANRVRQRLDGEIAGQMRRESGDIDLRVEVDYGRESLDTVGDIALQTPSGATVPLRTIADLRVERGPREIVRQGQTRVALVMADLEPETKLSDAIAAARSATDSIRLPGGYLLRFTGEEEQRAEAFGNLAFALGLSILLVYMVMASIFESFIQPFLILLSIPLAGIGVVAAFLMTGQTINVMALIGVVMLGGIVVNNAIVLLDRVNQLRAARPDLSSDDALVAGCQQRLRPVLMTTLTTLLGLLPLAMGVGEGAELRQAMAIAVLGGLTSSTVLTLFVIPVGQSVLDSSLVAARRLAPRLARRSKKPA